MDSFRNIGIIGRLGSTQVLDTIRRLKTFLLQRGRNVILENTIAEVLPGHGLQGLGADEVRQPAPCRVDRRGRRCPPLPLVD